MILLMVLHTYCSVNSDVTWKKLFYPVKMLPGFTNKLSTLQTRTQYFFKAPSPLHLWNAFRGIGWRVLFFRHITFHAVQSWYPPLPLPRITSEYFIKEFGQIFLDLLRSTSISKDSFKVKIILYREYTVLNSLHFLTH